MSLRVLHEGPHHVVVDKPTNMVVVRGRGAPRPTLLDLVTEQFGEDVRPVHRIDRGTSGCCAFAKTKFGQQALTEAFRRRVVDKRYLAIVEGEPSFKKLAIDVRLLRHDAPEARKGALAWQTVDDEGQRALTRVKVLGTTRGKALVEARPETGRMHQIRAHLAHVGHPIVDDELYQHQEGTHRRAPHAFALHAHCLSLPTPGGGRAFVIADVPQRFHEIWGEECSTLVTPLVEQFRRSEQKAAEAAPAKKARPPGPSASGKRPRPAAARPPNKRGGRKKTRR